MLEKLKNTTTRKKSFALLIAFAVSTAVYFAARMVMRSGKLMLFRFNLGFSIEEAGLLYDYQTVLVVLLSACVFGAALYLINHTLKYELLFPLLAFSFGFLYMFTITPLSVPDEITHFQAITELTGKLFLAGLDASLADFHGFTSQKNVCTGYLRIIRELFDKSQSGVNLYVDVMGGMWTLTYAAEYIPQIIGYAIAQLFHFNSVTALMLGRFFNLLFYVGCVYLALRIAPRFKLMLGMCSLMPMTLQQAASLSYDNFINALCLVLFACLLRLIFGEKTSHSPLSAPSDGKMYFRTFILTVVTAALLTPAKGIYAAFILLFLFVPNERFSGRLNKRGGFVILAAACVAFFAAISVPSLVRILSSTPPSYGIEGGEQYTLRFFLTNPSDALGMFQNSFNVSFATWFSQAVGQSLSTCNLELPTWIVPTFVLLLLLSAQNVEGNEMTMPKHFRTALIGISLLVVLTFMMTMFLTWIKTSDKLIIGVQGRYFTPIIPLLVAAANSRTLVLKKDIGKGLTMLTVLLSARTILAILDYTMFNV